MKLGQHSHGTCFVKTRNISKRAILCRCQESFAMFCQRATIETWLCTEQSSEYLGIGVAAWPCGLRGSHGSRGSRGSRGSGLVTILQMFESLTESSEIMTRLTHHDFNFIFRLGISKAFLTFLRYSLQSLQCYSVVFMTVTILLKPLLCCKGACFGLITWCQGLLLFVVPPPSHCCRSFIL